MERKFLIGWIATFVAWMIGSFIVHGALLRQDYLGLPQLFRPETESQKYFPLMLLAHVILAGAYVWIYSRGAEKKPWIGQGIRFGFAVALLTVVPTYMIYYVVQPMPGLTVVKQTLFDGCLIVVLGLIPAFIYGDRSPDVAG